MAKVPSVLQDIAKRSAIVWILRIAVAGEFIGHGVLALSRKPSWIAYFAVVGIGPDLANTLMPLIGGLDIALALIVLICPISPLLLWMALWGFITALIRPLAGESIWDFVERFANWGAPLALWGLMVGEKRKK